jgi:dUTP pyrophosphatase
MNNDIIRPGETSVISTGLAMSIPEGYELQIRPRSGLAAKFSVTVTNSPGTVDADYLDEIKVILTNMGSKDFHVRKSDRIAQAVLNKIEQAEIKEVNDFSEEIKRKDRGGGFGSTGV